MGHCRHTVSLVSVLLLLSSCEKALTPAEQAREDARAVAMVEAAQARNPPPVPLEPEPITPGDIAENHIGPACRFSTPGSPAGSPVLLIDERRALLKSAAQFLALAADPGSPSLAPGLKEHYVGKAQALTIERAPGDGSHPGEERLRWPTRVTVHDAWGQLVYAASGELVCGA